MRSTNDEPREYGEGIHQIQLHRLHPDPFQPRTEFSKRAIDDLANSIALHGVLTPLLVRPMRGPNSRGMFWIIAGERRLRAAQSLGLETLPCRIHPYENTTAAVIALAENIHRQNLSELEKAEALLRIKTLTDHTWEQIAELVRLSPDYVKRLVGLVKLQEPVKELLRDGKISARVAIALKPLRPKLQITMAQQAIEEGLSAEEIRARTQQPREGQRATAAPPPELDLAHSLPPSNIPVREGVVVRALHNCSGAVKEIDDWLRQRRWPALEASPGQRTALQELAEQVTRLQSRLEQINNAFRIEVDDEDPE
ncbi:MAG: ParB/RepB/Spo0J family partition protein [Actinomycetota bacterium]